MIFKINLRRKMLLFLAVGLGLQALYINGLPVTPTTRVVFVDDKTGEPIPNLHVAAAWVGFNAIIAAGANKKYHQDKFITSSDGSIKLPMKFKPLIPFFPVYFGGHSGTFLEIYSWHYAINEKDVAGMWQLRLGGNEFSKTFKLRKLTETGELIGGLGATATYFGIEKNRKEFERILKTQGLGKVQTKSLHRLAEHCRSWAGNACDELDKEILKRPAENVKDKYENHLRSQASLRLGVVTEDILKRRDELAEQEKANKKNGYEGLSITDTKEFEAIKKLLSEKGMRAGV